MVKSEAARAPGKAAIIPTFFSKENFLEKAVSARRCCATESWLPPLTREGLVAVRDRHRDQEDASRCCGKCTGFARSCSLTRLFPSGPQSVCGHHSGGYAAGATGRRAGGEGAGNIVKPALEVTQFLWKMPKLVKYPCGLPRCRSSKEFIGGRRKISTLRAFWHRIVIPVVVASSPISHHTNFAVNQRVTSFAP